LIRHGDAAILRGSNNKITERRMKLKEVERIVEQVKTTNQTVT
jgi:hypothetical protein